MKKYLTKPTLMVFFVLSLCFGIESKIFAITAPLQSITLTSQTQGQTVNYNFSVFDQQRNQTITGSTGFQTSSNISNPLVRDGVVSWVVNTGSGNFPNRTIYMSVYDPRFGNWRTAGYGTDPGAYRYQGMDSFRGIVRWQMNDSTTNPVNVDHHFAAYDPAAGFWREVSKNNYTSSTAYTVSTPIIGDGIAMFVYSSNNASSSTKGIYTYAFDASRGGWRGGYAEHYIANVGSTPFSITNVSNGTVYYKIGANNYTLGYRGDSGVWAQAVGFPVAFIVASQSTGNAPLKTYFWDMSVGGTGWNINFGDGNSTGTQSPFYTYNSAIGSPFNAVQTVSSPGGTRTYGTAINVTTPHSISGTVANPSGFKISGATVNLSGSLTRTAQTDSNGNYSFPNLTGGGNYTVTVSKNRYAFVPPTASFSNLNGAQTANFTGKLNDKVSDFDGDGKTDYSIFRPSVSEWWIYNVSNNSANYTIYGLSTDKITPRDFDGDGKVDVAVWRPSNGVWYIFKSSDLTYTSIPFGQDGDVPVAADYDGDDKADFAVYRPSDNAWYVLRSSNSQFFAVVFGLATDKLVPADYDGDGKTDIAVYRPEDSVWYILKSSNSSYVSELYGEVGDSPVPGDYDGDGKADLATFRPSDLIWRIKRSSDSVTTLNYFGYADDIRTPGDYDGDGLQDICVFRPATGAWYVIQSSNQAYTSIVFGQTNDIPTPKSYLPE